jgi:hypothetical protein
MPVTPPPKAPSATERFVDGAIRLVRVYRALSSERRLAAYAAIGLFLVLFLPWYQETVVAVATKPQTASTSVTGWGAFSFVEAAVLLVAAGVLCLLFQRAEGRAFHLPGGDGWVIMGAGFWSSILIFWRIFDKQSVNVHGPGTSVSGIEWGIFVALAVAVLLTYTGVSIRRTHAPEPVPGDQEVEPVPPEPAQPIVARRRQARRARPVVEVEVADPPTLRLPGDDAAQTHQLPRPDTAETHRLHGPDTAGTHQLPRPDTAETQRLHREDQLTIPFDEV